jgi:carboxymethylenebutenolidase
MSGGMIEFSGNGSTYSGYLAPSASGSGPGVIVIQEWWGLVGHIKNVADRLAAEGFNALAPDFYHGVTTDEPDEAGSLMMALNIADAEKVLSGAVDALLAHPSTVGDRVGAVGFCMGGQLALFAACCNGRVGACVNFYGVHPNVQPNFSNLSCPVMGFFAENDDYASPERVRQMSEALSGAGKKFEFKTFPGTQHAFFNDDRPEVFHPASAEECWARMLPFLRQNLG